MPRSEVNLGAGGFRRVGFYEDGGAVVDVSAEGEEHFPEEMPSEGEDIEKGLGSVFLDKLAGESPVRDIRESGRMYDPYVNEKIKELYGSDPTFMEQLIERYDYPTVMEKRDGVAHHVIPTDWGFPESKRFARPEDRKDLPTFPELEDARAHILGSAIMAKEYGPETAEKAGNFQEFMDRFAPSYYGRQTPRDVAMDKRNNAVGRQIFVKAGMDASVQELTQMVDAAIFEQLDQILGRTEEERMTPAKDQPRAPRNFVSPPTGPDLYFPRDEEGFFDTTY